MFVHLFILLCHMSTNIYVHHEFEIAVTSSENYKKLF